MKCVTRWCRFYNKELKTCRLENHEKTDKRKTCRIQDFIDGFTADLKEYTKIKHTIENKQEK